MSGSTNIISGLSSGFDWQSMVTQLIAIDHKRVDLISDKKTETKTRLTEWQSFNSKLTALMTATDSLRDPEDFGVYKATTTTDSSTVMGFDLMTVSVSSEASIGSYEVKINTVAAAQKLSSNTFTNMNSAMGAAYAGDILINGAVVSISATDTLDDVRAKINDANSGADPTGVTASIIRYGTSDYRLVLTSDSTGADGIGLLNGGAADVLHALGFTDSSRTAKNHLTGGDRTDSFSSTGISIKSLLGLTTTQTSEAGDIVINGQAIGAIDLGTDTLSTLQTKLATAGLSVSITTETDDNQTYYRLMVAGATNTYTDKNNILETLGFIQGGVSDLAGVTGDTANTTAGAAITADTLLKDIDGFTGYQTTDYIHLEGTDTDGGTVTDDTLILSDTTTVGDLLSKIEAVFGDVTASVTGAGKLLIVDNTPEASPLTVKIQAKNQGGTNEGTLVFDADGNLGSAITIRKRELVAGADASLTVDGVTLSRTSNTVDDVITGVTLDLLKADTETTITLNVTRDIDAVVSKINSFVSAYNTVSAYIHTQSSYDETNQKAGGILFGDGTLASVKSDLTSILIENVWGVSQNYSTMGLVGISVDTSGQLSVNDSTLRGYLLTNFNDIQNLFTARGTGSVGTLQYVSHGQDAKQGEYTVHITTAATKSTSAASNNTSLGSDETLTITEGDSTATIHLTSGMTMNQIVNAINSEFQTFYSQILTGGEQLYADDHQAAEITAETKWNSIYGSDGQSAGLVEDDVLTFSGKNHKGAVVTGSYTISNIESDTLQGLLSAIETAFNNEVTAAINSYGRLSMTDKTEGSSEVEIAFDYGQAHNLDFGSVATTNTGGREGRYSVEVTASLDGTNHLILAHNSYGSLYGFTIHQENNLLWTGGDQTVENGVDVAGTINGEAATGAGQLLTGDTGTANTDGLVVKYTGTAQGVDAGSVKLTYGVAELFNNILYQMTDTIEGYVTFKQTSLQDSITNFTDQISQMEDLLDKKQETMINRFVAMELALSKIQNQSNWLAAQLTSANSAWK